MRAHAAGLPSALLAALAALAALVAAVACGHGEPFAVPDTGTDQPLQPGAPTQLTYNALLDSEIAWSADGSALIYTATRADQPNLSRCIELLPPGGGRSLRSFCPSPLIQDSTVALESGAVSPSGQVIYLRSAKSPLNPGWATGQREFVLAALDGRVRRVVAAIPFAGSIQPHGGASQLRWLNEDRFVYLAEDYQVNFCLGCVPYDSATGLFVVSVDLRCDPATFTLVPGTNGATGVAVESPDAILYTVGGDAHVYRQALSTGAVTALWDFGTGHSVSWAQRAGNRLAAIVDTSIYVVDLTAGTSAPLGSVAYGSLALSPDGRRLVAQRSVFGQSHLVGASNQPSGDLWLFDIP